MIQNNNMVYDMYENIYIYTYVPRVMGIFIARTLHETPPLKRFVHSKSMTTISNHPKNQPRLLQLRQAAQAPTPNKRRKRGGKFPHKAPKVEVF